MPTPYSLMPAGAREFAEDVYNKLVAGITATVTTLSKLVSSGDCKLDAASNAVATLTLADPGAGVANVIGGVYWSYNGTPTGGKLTIQDNGTSVFEVDITSAGPGFLPFSPPKKFTAHTATNITLAAGGSGVTGKVNANRWTE